MDSLTKLFFCLVAVTAVSQHSANAADRTPPTVRLFSIDSSNRIGKVIPAEPNSEVILETEDASYPGVRMECTAPYPVQWVYSGNGIPTSEQSILTSSPSEFRSILVIKNLLETHTGKYKCSNVEVPSILTYVYVYVPGQTLFVPTAGKPVEVSSKYVLLPCTASSPRIKVYLQKVTGPQLVRPGTYDPRRGYTFEVEEPPKAEGTYICKGAYRGITNVLEYQVTVIQPEEDHSIQSDPRSPEIVSESDVPCNPRCTENAKCLLRGSYSECQCLQPFQGDGYKQCIDPSGQSQRPPAQLESGAGPGCKTHTDCPDENSCFVDGKCRDPCIHSQHGLKCATYAVCKTVNHQPTCACPAGSYGDGTKSCSTPYQGDAPGPGSSSSPRSTPRPRTTTRPRTPSTSRPSGPEYEYICRVDADCGKGKICNVTVCMDPCENLCGINANCKVVNGVPLCSCKTGHRGDPWKRCDPTDAIIKLLTPDPIKSLPQEASSSKLGAKICDTSADCPEKYVCKGYKCIDPCSKCADDAECDLYDGEKIPKCRCPEGHTGDGEVGCLPDLQVEDTFDFFPDKSSGQSSSAPSSSAPSSTDYGQNSSLCQDLSCGPHSECRLIENLPKCNCLSGYIGSPPNCRAECSADSDCSGSKLCIQKRCRSACYGKCGAFARCRNNPGTKSQICTCRKGYGGDPYKECRPL